MILAGIIGQQIGVGWNPEMGRRHDVTQTSGLAFSTAQVHQASNFIHLTKPTKLLTVWKIRSHRMICVMKTMNDGWKLKFKLHSKT
jgi:hypothetical protein